MAAAFAGAEVLDFGGLSGSAAVVAGDGADAIGGAGGVVAWADDHGEDQFVPAVEIGEGVEVADLDVDLFAGFDVGDALGEDVGAFLCHEGGDVALGAGFVVDFFGFGAFADDAADVAVADGHDELVDAGVFGEREDVDGFDFGAVGVLELLGDVDAGDVAGDVGGDVGVLEGNGDEFSVVFFGSESAGAGDGHGGGGGRGLSGGSGGRCEKPAGTMAGLGGGGGWPRQVKRWRGDLSGGFLDDPEFFASISGRGARPAERAGHARQGWNRSACLDDHRFA